MEGCQKNGGWWNLGVATGIGQAGGGGAEVKNLVEVAAKGGKLVGQWFLLSHNCKIASEQLAILLAPVIYGFRSRLRWCMRCRRSNSRLMSEIFSNCSF